jgi:acyl carrier protein
MHQPKFEELQKIIATEFNVPVEFVTRETTADDIDSWNSISHAVLITRIECEFGITLDDDQAYALDMVGELYELIIRDHV